MKKIERLLKYLEGGKIEKFANPAGPITPQIDRIARIGKLAADYGLSRELATELVDDDEAYDNFMSDRTFGNQNTFTPPQKNVDNSTITTLLRKGIPEQTFVQDPNKKLSDLQKALDTTNTVFGALGFNPVDAKLQYDEYGNPIGMSPGGQMALGITAQAVSKGAQLADQVVMGDKNFSASSKAIDTTVHGVSGALMKSGNPYAIAAGAALEGLNFITKAGGKNVPGYDVNITNSGYGNLGHQESEAGRIWDNWTGATARKLQKRNEQVKMALAASDISEDQQYEQEARTNSVSNILQLNLIALAGGIDTSLLAG